MTLREALELLGVDRVRRGVIALTKPHTIADAARCFVGCAFGGIGGYFAIRGGCPSEESRRQYTPLQQAAWLCERYYEGLRCIDGQRLPFTTGEQGRELLYQECVLFLAEHGAELEPCFHKVSEAVV